MDINKTRDIVKSGVCGHDQAAAWLSDFISIPFLNFTSVITFPRNSNPFSFLQLFSAHIPSLNIMCSMSRELRHPLLFPLLRLIVPKADSIGFVVLMLLQMFGREVIECHQFIPCLSQDTALPSGPGPVQKMRKRGRIIQLPFGALKNRCGFTSF